MSNSDSGDNSSLKKNSISRRRLLGSASLIAASAAASTALPGNAASETPSVLPPPEPPFKGHIERTLKGSTPDFPKGIEASATSSFAQEPCLAHTRSRFGSVSHLGANET